MILKPKRVEKSWGYELWIHNDSQYCGKLLVFPEITSHFSMHYHMIKNETWYVQSGKFSYLSIDTRDGSIKGVIINEGDSVYVPKGQPHQLIALEKNSTIFEVSTEHFDDDSYRIYRDSPTDLMITSDYEPKTN